MGLTCSTSRVGEQYGSEAARNGINSWVAVVWADEKSKRAVKTKITWYGRVSYYLKHTFMGKEHSYAMVRWYDWVGQGNKRPEFAALLPAAMAQYYSDVLPAKHSSFAEYPIVAIKHTGMNAEDLVAVHRLAYRWIPVKLDRLHQVVCRIRTKEHA